MVVAVAGAACTVLALVRPRLILLAGFALAALLSATGSPRPALAALPWLCIVAAHLFFAAQSPRTLAHPLRTALADVRARLVPSTPRDLAGAKGEG
jgi:hypothetical protein